MENREYYVCTPGMGPVKVTDMVKDEGFRVIGRYKLWNPKPMELTKNDIDTICAMLPQWLKDNNIEQKLVEKDINKLKEYAKYEFTILHFYGMLEADVYILKNEKDSRNNIYILKGIVPNKDLTGVDTQINLKDEKWHQNIDDTSLYKPGDLS